MLRVRVEVESEPSLNYRLESATRLPSGRWEEVATREGTGGVLRFENLLSDQTSRFFRVVVLAPSESLGGALR